MASEVFDDDDGAEYVVGYRRPPLHTRFQPGQSGNPSGRPKGSPNLKTLFDKILKEQISLREGNVTKKITKAEAIIRGLVIGALKGDARSVATLLRVAEQTGEFENEVTNEPLVIQWLSNPSEVPSDPPSRERYPAIRKLNRDGS